MSWQKVADFTRRVSSSVSSSVADTAWRVILNKHPALRQVFAEGNEHQLAQLRRQHPKLEQTIARFGLPSENALRPPSNSSTMLSNLSSRVSTAIGLHTTPSVLYGEDSSPLRQAEAQQIVSAICDQAMKDNFKADGFAHFERIIPPVLFDRARRAINRWLELIKPMFA